MNKKKVIQGLSLTLVILIVLAFVLNDKKQKAGNESAKEDEISEESSETEEKTEQIVTSEGGRSEDSLYDTLDKMLDKHAYADALGTIEQCAAEGNADAMYLAGEMYFQGLGTQADTAHAADYFRQACDMGNKNAFSIYAKLCFMGDGISQDYEEAFKYFLPVSEENADNACALGIMYALGMGTPIDYDKANKYLDQAIAGGNEAASVMKSAITGMSESAGYQIREQDLDVALKKIEYTDEHKDMGILMEQLCKELKDSEQYDAFSKELDAMAHVSPAVASGITLFGKDNWLFLQNPADGDALHDYIGDNEYKEDELKKIASDLNSWKNKIEASGSQFILMIIPNKEVIYSEKMPAYIQRINEATKTDKLVDYLKENTDLTILYPKADIMALKNDHQLYYSTDTHCNMLGSYVVLSQLLNTVYGKNMSLDENQFTIHAQNYTGDLAVMLGRDDRYAIDKDFFLPGENVPDEDKVDASMTLIGDSFSEFLDIEAEYYFNNGVDHVMIGDYGFDYETATDSALERFSNDIVVWECVERYIDRMK